MVQQQNKKFTFKFGAKKIIFNKAHFEPEVQLFAKVLAYAIYHKQYPTIRVEPQMDERDRFQPDLNAASYDGTMLLWIECGTVSMSKVEKLFKKYRQAHFVFVKERKDIEVFQKNLGRYTKDARSLPRIDILVYPEKFSDWWVSEEGDVFIPPEEVEIIQWHDPEKDKKW